MAVLVTWCKAWLDEWGLQLRGRGEAVYGQGHVMRDKYYGRITTSLVARILSWADRVCVDQRARAISTEQRHIG